MFWYHFLNQVHSSLVLACALYLVCFRLQYVCVCVCPCMCVRSCVCVCVCMRVCVCVCVNSCMTSAVCMALAAKQVITICLTGLVLVIWFIVRGILGIWHYNKRQNVSVIKWMCQVFGESCKITLAVHMTSSYIITTVVASTWSLYGRTSNG